MVNRSSLSIYQFFAIFVLSSSCILYHLQSPVHIYCNALATNYNNNKSKTYNYFAFGSNMYTSTMINLRGIQPISSTAAVLPKHELRFNIPGVHLIEPSSASVEPTNDMSKEVVHGVFTNYQKKILRPFVQQSSSSSFSSSSFSSLFCPSSVS